jgi:hypothetical protein
VRGDALVVAIGDGVVASVEGDGSLDSVGFFAFVLAGGGSVLPGLGSTLVKTLNTNATTPITIDTVTMRRAHCTLTLRVPASSVETGVGRVCFPCVTAGIPAEPTGEEGRLSC